jgi:uncharacterized membrane protein YbhN (UPF0104 family)
METATATLPERKRFNVRRTLVIAGVVLAFGLASWALGWDVRGRLSDLWDVLTSISLASLVAGIAFQTLQTLLTAYAWYSILRFGYPEAPISRLQIVACYAASVALNNVLPANIGTLALLLMFTAIIAGATFAGVLAGYLVHKIFFTIAGAFVYLYLFLSVGGSFDIKFQWVHDHPASFVLIAAGVVVLVLLLVRVFWPKLRHFWDEAKEGGQVLSRPRTYFARVFAPELGAWISKLCVIAVFLGAYGIPVTFHTVMSVVGGNSIANVTSVTPGGAGVNQAFNVASLREVTDPTTATAYSVGQQLFTTAWNIVFACVLMVWAFGWTGGKQLVSSSYVGAKEKAAEQAAARKARKEERSS